MTFKTLGERELREMGQRDEDGHTTGSRLWDREKLPLGLRMERRGQERFSC